MSLLPVKELLTVNIARAESFFFKAVTTIRLLTSQRMVLYACIYGKLQLDLMVFFFLKRI